MQRRIGPLPAPAFKATKVTIHVSAKTFSTGGAMRRGEGRGKARRWRGDGEEVAKGRRGEGEGKARRRRGDGEEMVRGRRGEGEGMARRWRGEGEEMARGMWADGWTRSPVLTIGVCVSASATASLSALRRDPDLHTRDTRVWTQRAAWTRASHDIYLAYSPKSLSLV